MNTGQVPNLGQVSDSDLNLHRSKVCSILERSFTVSRDAFWDYF